MATPQRRLSAILHADVAGFVRRHLKSTQAEVWRPAIEIAGGTLVDNAGDSRLAEFGSARAAVAAAIDIQERMAHQNEMLAEERRLMLRIGVHLGEVIVDESGHIFGDSINLAARIQSLADPGGIAVSRAVRDIIKPQDFTPSSMAASIGLRTSAVPFTSIMCGPGPAPRRGPRRPPCH